MICDIQVFQRGSKGECVKRIQQAVSASVDGIFGQQTQRQVKKFQAFNNLPEDGIFDADDWAKLKTNYSNPPSVAVTQTYRAEDAVWWDGPLPDGISSLGGP